MMRLTRWLCTALLLAASASLAGDDERILRYHSDLVIEADGAVIVSEHITVRSMQRNIRRGIYRDFPTRYQDRLGNRVVVDFEVIEVLRDGQTETWFAERRLNGIRVNTGDDSLLPGPGDYTFTIRYRIHRQLGFFDEHDELYWNVTGLGWAFPIDHASASVSLPSAVPESQLRLHHFTGAAGARGSHASARVAGDGRVLFETGQPLAAGEGLTISVGFPKGLVQAPSQSERIGWFVRDNRGVLVLGLGGLGILFFYFSSWLSKGRGPKPGIIIARYEPPEGYSPAGLRYVLRQSHDPRCFSADVVELGVRGLLRIVHDQGRFSERWRLEQLEPADRPTLPASQAALLPKLFEKGPELDLKSSNASRVQAAMSAQSTALKQRYHGRYIEPNTGTLVVGWLLSIALGGLSLLVAAHISLSLVIGLVLLGVINLVFTGLMPAPTEEGRRLLDHIEGLKKYLSVAEKQDLARLQQRAEGEPALTPERFEALLPYAIALDVEDAWTSRLTRAVGQAAADEVSNRMGWYAGSKFSRRLSPSHRLSLSYVCQLFTGLACLESSHPVPCN